MWLALVAPGSKYYLVSVVQVRKLGGSERAVKCDTSLFLSLLGGGLDPDEG